MLYHYTSRVEIVVYSHRQTQPLDISAYLVS